MERRGTNPSYNSVKLVFGALERTEQQGLKSRGSAPILALMNKRILSVRTDERVKRAIQVMRESDVSQLPVFSGEGLVGSVSEGTIFDLLQKGLTLEKVSEMRVEKIMGSPFPVVPATAGTESVKSFLDEFPAVLICAPGSGKIVGIATKADLLKAFSLK
jgi:predicted transcriptional regulator